MNAIHETLRPALVTLACLAPAVAAQEPYFLPFGDGCPGTYGTPDLHVFENDRPQVGSTFQVEIDQLGPTGFALGLIGNLDHVGTWGVPLPLELDFVGMPGCQLFTSIWRQDLLTVDAGRALWELNIPGDADLMGYTFFLQALVEDQGVNPFGWIASNAAEGRIGDRPELIVVTSRPTLSSRSVQPGDWIDVEPMRIRNLSDYVESGAFSTGYVLGNVTILSSRRQVSMAPDELREVPGERIQIPPGTPPGTYRFSFEVDLFDEVDEWDDIYNTKGLTFTVEAPPVPQPDLAFSGNATPGVSSTTPFAGDRITVDPFTLVNQGNFPATGFNTGIYLSSDLTNLRGGALLDRFSVGGLVQGLPLGIGSIDVTIPADTPPGFYWLGFAVDDQNGIAESDEFNNEVARLIRVQRPLPDLVVTSGSIGLTTVIVRAFIWTAAPCSVGTFTVENQGGSHSGPFTVGYYYSENNPTITSNDDLMATVTHPGLAPGESHTFPIHAVVLPTWGMSPHNPWVGVLVDHENLIQEQDETNNWTSNRTYIF